MTLGDALRGRNNALNALRLLLAFCVLLSHSRALGGFGPSPHLNGVDMGSAAVAGFFAISGYLIPVSRGRSTLRNYTIKRAARILPGLLVCLLVVAFIAAPVGAMLAGVAFNAHSAAMFVILNGTTLYLHHGIGAELAGVPFPVAWNGSLWTLQWEVLCYVIAGAVARRGATRAPIIAVAVMALPGMLPNAGPQLALLTCFAAGWALGIYRDKVRVSAATAVVALLATLVAVAAGATLGMTAAPLAYVVLCLGTAPVRLGNVRDLSYGVYIYGFPVEQLLAAAHWDRFGWVAYALAAVGATALLAWASWSLVESPALRLTHAAASKRRWVTGSRATDSTPALSVPSAT